MEIKTKWLKNQPKTNGRKSHRNSFGLPGIYGDSRHVRYVAFLWENYFLVHVSIESKNSLDLNTVRNNVKMVRF